jgi:murein DD-endopeptidase MepM/ murein hydrolase activator NlpD
MHVILMSERLGGTFSFRFDIRHTLFLAGLLLVALVGAALTTYHFAADAKTGLVADSQPSPQFDQLAMRIGELQARLARLSAIGERVANKAGVPLPDADKADPGRGGPLLEAEGRPADATEIARVLDSLALRLEQASDHMMVLDAELLMRQARLGKLPMDRPITETGYVSSVFGIRTDPFTRRRARHEGMDFADDLGAPILAAESGVVLTVTSHPQYGNSLIIDHGNGLTTRYAHTSRVLVKQGDLVKRGQEIAEIGSTGRSTGPHLHFEVLKDGVQQNPITYLSARS